MTARAPRTAGWGKLAAACAGAGLTAFATGCGATPVYGPAQPGAAAPGAHATVGLRPFRQAETGPAARTFQADAATFNRDSRNPRLAPAVLAEDAYQLARDIRAWSQAMNQVPLPPPYRQVKARLLTGLGLLRSGYQQIGDGLLYHDAGQLGRGRAQVQAGSRLLASAPADTAV